ncbi:hypothetical protein [Streptomyces sp. C10-9-1]|uniref:hypothetical protein n=1 Tax=Streptomyces sp. C10-9-1 TaxID=1859285 RepID=UPI003F4A1D2B
MPKKPNPVHAVQEAAEALGQFNHQSFATGPNWEYPPHTYRALGSLTQLAHRLAQAIAQSVAPAERTHAEGRLAIDHGGSPARELNALLAARVDALLAVRHLITAVEAMHSASAAMGLDTTGLAEFGGTSR